MNRLQLTDRAVSAPSKLAGRVHPSKVRVNQEKPKVRRAANSRPSNSRQAGYAIFPGAIHLPQPDSSNRSKLA